MRQLLIIAIIALSTTLSACEHSNNGFDPRFQDHMVLQQGVPQKIYGSAYPGALIEVRYGDIIRQTKSNQASQWTVSLPALSAHSGQDLSVTITHPGNRNLRFTQSRRNVAVGEVWLCAGQSNMQFFLYEAQGWSPEKAETIPGLRLFKTQLTQDETERSVADGHWAEVDGDSNDVRWFSAVCYFYGRELQRKLGVPVGVMMSSWGGTPIQAWTRVKMDAEHFKPGDKVDYTPKLIFNGMIAPHTRTPISGVVWYQGENNLGDAYSYRNNLPRLIQDWRTAWKRDDLPFYIIQLSSLEQGSDYKGDSYWAEMRESQFLTAQGVPHTTLTVITDIGDRNDIHPKNKKTVAERVALHAYRDIYQLRNSDGQLPQADGPIYQAYSIEGGSIRIHFKSSDSPLWSTGQLRGFTIAGADHNWLPARARVEGNTLVVWSPDVSAPMAVRYGWNDYSDGNLYNEAGLPASPFRTDDWPHLSE